MKARRNGSAERERLDKILTVRPVIKRESDNVFVSGKAREVNQSVAHGPTPAWDEHDDWASRRRSFRRRCKGIHVQAVLALRWMLVEELLEDILSWADV